MRKITDWLTSLPAANAFTLELNDQLAAQVKLLLEEKHLYQKVMVDPGPIEKEVLEHALEPEATKLRILKICANNLTPTAGTAPRAIPLGGGADTVLAALPIPNVRLFCETCNERNVYRPVWYRDVSSELLKQIQRGDEPFETASDIYSNQLFFVALQCQHCKGQPEGLIIRREGFRFSLDGRAPIERIQLPSYIPKSEANLFRDALVARFTGKNLAAAYYLRAFIEQFARRLTGLKGVRRTGDEIMDAYAQLLPVGQRSVMPSLKEWYEKLSDPLHLADENQAEGVFDEARPAIENHFDIRRALKIPELTEKQETSRSGL
jgi:hypothetical protein